MSEENPGQATRPAQSRRALLQQRLMELAGAAPTPQRIERRGEDGPAPLSFAQQRLWFLEQLEPGTPFYNTWAVHEYRGALDEDAMERALREVVRRHETLRTRFVAAGVEPVQVAGGWEGFRLPRADLRGIADAGREGEVRRAVSRLVRAPLDLEAGPPLRAALLRSGEGEWVLALVIHHAVSDGWSFGILFRELFALYTAFAGGLSSPLPELAIQYADFAVWQREHLAGERLEEQLTYWRGELEGAPEVLDLPADRPRPPVPSRRGGRHVFRVPPELAERLRAIAQEERATLFMVLLSGFQVLLSRYSGQEDVVVGTPIANRNRREVEELIGFFVNTLALRADLAGDPTFRGLLAQTRRRTLSAYAHQDLPFERLVEELAPERTLSHAPLFQVLFALQNTASSPAAELPGVRVRAREAHSGIAKFDLSLSMEEYSGGVAGSLEYALDLFDPATAERIGRHLVTLLEAVAADPGRRISELPMLAPDETRRLVEEWSAAETGPVPSDRCVHELFAEQAARTPDAVALVWGEATLTYAELDRRSDRLAHVLAARGVGPDVRVGVCVERSPEL
ncbi:MAG TPA: condensation domain-containing protein, partial [Longimicrobiaceae bacterium]